jgi:geranylgeranyl diphosphate synthase type II
VGPELVTEYMADCRRLVLDELRRIVPNESKYSSILYDLVFEYPLREAKALRPSLCIAICGALGGSIAGVTTSATVLELYHNAFLIHDDIEDSSELRRDEPTLHRRHGIPVAVNVGDAMLALALEPLLDNMRLLSLGKALRILQTIARMARESAEGQALELAWIRDQSWSLTASDYFRMVHKKTSHYTFIAPMVVGAIVADASAEQLVRLRLFATALGIAFQIQDDILSLTGREDATGKEIDGDLWEGKHTLILIHALSHCGVPERVRALGILRKARPQRPFGSDTPSRLRAVASALAQTGELTQAGLAEFQRALDAEQGRGLRTPEDVQFLKALIGQSSSISYAKRVARRWAERASDSIGGMDWLAPCVHSAFLENVTEFVVERDS